MSEKTLKSNLVYNGNLLKVYKDEVELADGGRGSREFIKHPGASVVLAIDSDREILFVRQYRYSMQKSFLELPAGKKDLNEGPIETAKRELIEETGYSAGRLKHIADMNPCIGYSDEVIHLVLAEDLKFVGSKPDVDEVLTFEKYPIEIAMDKIKCGEITDVKTAFGIFWYYNFLFKKP